MRKIISVLAASALLASTLAGCASTSETEGAFSGLSATCKPFTTGNTADQIKLSKTTAGKPEVTYPVPLRGDTVETKVLVEGKGPKFLGDQLVDLDFIGLNAGTGAEFQASSFDGKNFASQFINKDGEPNFCDAIGGAREGSTVAIYYPAKIVHDNQGIESIGIGKDQGIVFVFKLIKFYLPKATGKPGSLKDGFPQIAVGSTGAPGLVLQDWAKPAFTEFAKETTIVGNGEVVKLNDKVTVHYSGWVWSEEKSQFDSSWEKQVPAQFQLSHNQLIEGFIKALRGEKVGSQVVAVIPPSDGYGDSDQGGIPANSTLIFVVDILGTERTENSK